MICFLHRAAAFDISACMNIELASKSKWRVAALATLLVAFSGACSSDTKKNTQETDRGDASRPPKNDDDKDNDDKDKDDKDASSTPTDNRGDASSGGISLPYTPPEGVPADFCRPFAECCYATQAAETCDAILTSYYAVRDFISEEELDDACTNGCTLPVCGEGDDVTLETLRAAKAQLEDGATDVKLSKFGCQSYSRSIEDGVVVSERMVSGEGSDQNVFEAEYSPTRVEFKTGQTRGETWSAIATANDEGELEKVVVSLTSATSGIPLRRDTYTPIDDETLHVVTEVSSEGSELFEAGEYDVPEAMPAFGSVPSADLKTEGCSAAQTAELKSMLEDMIVEAFECMRDKGRADIASFLLRTYFGNTITLSCANAGSEGVAHISMVGKFTSHFFGYFGVEINVDRFFSTKADGSRTYSPEQLKNVLMHELLHLRFGPHQPGLVGSEREFEADPTYACAALCFEARADDRTKCACAVCLNTDICDSRCQEFKECDGNMGATCNALPLKWYASPSDCAMSCTAPCKVHNVRCDSCN